MHNKKVSSLLLKQMIAEDLRTRRCFEFTVCYKFLSSCPTDAHTVQRNSYKYFILQITYVDHMNALEHERGSFIEHMH